MNQEKDKIVYGDVDLDDTYFEPANHKVRVTAFIDGDVLQWLKKEASEKGIGYQTFMNMKLKELASGAEKPLSRREIVGLIQAYIKGPERSARRTKVRRERTGKFVGSESMIRDRAPTQKRKRA